MWFECRVCGGRNCKILARLPSGSSCMHTIQIFPGIDFRLCAGSPYRSLAMQLSHVACRSSPLQHVSTKFAEHGGSAEQFAKPCLGCWRIDLAGSGGVAEDHARSMASVWAERHAWGPADLVRLAQPGHCKLRLRLASKPRAECSQRLLGPSLLFSLMNRYRLQINVVLQIHSYAFLMCVERVTPVFKSTT